MWLIKEEVNITKMGKYALINEAQFYRNEEALSILKRKYYKYW